MSRLLLQPATWPYLLLNPEPRGTALSPDSVDRWFQELFCDSLMSCQNFEPPKAQVHFSSERERADRPASGLYQLQGSNLDPAIICPVLVLARLREMEIGNQSRESVQGPEGSRSHFCSKSPNSPLINDDEDLRRDSRLLDEGENVPPVPILKVKRGLR